MILERAKKKQIWTLVLCAVWLVLGVESFYRNDNAFNKYAYLTVGILYLVMLIYNYKKGFGKLEDNMLIINGFKSKKLDLTVLTEVKYFAGDLILKTENDQIGISKNSITPKSFKAVENNTFVQATLLKKQ